ncbi:YggT family protein [bacterium]|nr:YggT family protein [bacterium]
MISTLLYYFFIVLYAILIFYIVCTWIPQVNWYKEPFATAKTISDFVFAPFRKIIPPIGMLDISPIIAFIALKFIEYGLIRLFVSFGL